MTSSGVKDWASCTVARGRLTFSTGFEARTRLCTASSRGPQGSVCITAGAGGLAIGLHAQQKACHIGRTQPVQRIVADVLLDVPPGQFDVENLGGLGPVRRLPDTTRVRSLTLELSKGLEFDLVVLTDADTFGGGIEGAVDRMSR